MDEWLGTGTDILDLTYGCFRKRVVADFGKVIHRINLLIVENGTYLLNSDYFGSYINYDLGGVHNLVLVDHV